MTLTSIDLTIEELMTLHKQGNQEATICLLKIFEGLMNKYSYISNYKKIVDPDTKNCMMIACLKALNNFDINRYVDLAN